MMGRLLAASWCSSICISYSAVALAQAAEGAQAPDATTTPAPAEGQAPADEPPPPIPPPPPGYGSPPPEPGAPGGTPPGAPAGPPPQQQYGQPPGYPAPAYGYGPPGYGPPPGQAPPPYPGEPREFKRKEGVRLHDGFYLRLALGGGYFMDHFDSKESSNYAAGTLEGSARGAAVAFDIAIGGTLAPGFVLGGAILANGIPSARTGDLRSNGDAVLSEGQVVEYNSYAFSMLGAFADYYIDPSGGFHIQGALGLGGIDADRGDVDGTPVIVDHNAGGIGVMLGVGYEWFVSEQWSLGGLARVMYGAFSSDKKVDGDFSHSAFVLPAVMFGATYH